MKHEDCIVGIQDHGQVKSAVFFDHRVSRAYRWTKRGADRQLWVMQRWHLSKSTRRDRSYLLERLECYGNELIGWKISRNEGYIWPGSLRCGRCGSDEVGAKSADTGGVAFWCWNCGKAGGLDEPWIPTFSRALTRAFCRGMARESGDEKDGSIEVHEGHTAVRLTGAMAKDSYRNLLFELESLCSRKNVEPFAATVAFPREGQTVISSVRDAHGNVLSEHLVVAAPRILYQAIVVDARCIRDLYVPGNVGHVETLYLHDLQYSVWQ